MTYAPQMTGQQQEQAQQPETPEQPEQEQQERQYTPFTDAQQFYSPAPISEDFGKKISKTVKAQYKYEQIEEEWVKNDRDRLLCSLGKRALAMIKAGVEVRMPRDRMVRDMQLALNMIPEDRESPLGPDGANIRTPLTYKARNTLHAFFLEVTTGIRPYFNTEALKDDDTDSANRIEDYLDSVLTEQVDWYTVQDESIGMALDEGICFLYPCWEREISYYRDYSLLTKENANSFGFKLPEGVEPKYGMMLSHDTQKERTARLGQMIDGYRFSVIKNCPSVKVISYFDYFQYPARRQDPDKTTLSGRRFFASFDEMRHGVVNGLYDGEMLNLVECSDDFKPIDEMNKTNLYLDKEDMVDNVEAEEYEEGAEANSESAVKSETFDSAQDSQRLGEWCEFCIRFDGDGNNLEEDWLCTLETSTGYVVRMQHFIGTPGKRYLRPLTIFKRPGKLYGMPIGQILEGLQEERDVCTNMALDAGAINLTLIVEEERGNSSQLTPRELRVGLNHRVVNEAGKIEVHNFPMPTQEAFIPGREVDDYANEATAISETMGGQVNKENKTATETQQALTAGARRLKVGSKRIQNVNEEVAALILADLRRYAVLPGDNGQVPMALHYALSQGEDRVYGDITLEEMYTPVKIFAQGDTINTNQQLMLQGAEKVWMMQERDPIFLGGSYSHKYAVERHVLQSYGVRNLKDMMGTKREATQKDVEQAQAPKPPTIPQVESNINDEYLAVFLAQNNATPELAQMVLSLLGQIKMADAQAKAATQGADGGAVLEQKKQLAKQEIDTHFKGKKMEDDMRKKEIQHTAKMAQMDISHKIDEGQQQQEMQGMQQAHDNQMQTEQMRMEGESQRQKIQAERAKLQVPANGSKKR